MNRMTCNDVIQDADALKSSAHHFANVITDLAIFTGRILESVSEALALMESGSFLEAQALLKSSLGPDFNPENFQFPLGFAISNQPQEEVFP